MSSYNDPRVLLRLLPPTLTIVIEACAACLPQVQEYSRRSIRVQNELDDITWQTPKYFAGKTEAAEVLMQVQTLECGV